MAEELLDALLDTLKLVPWLLIMHVLIEVFEYHAVSKIKLNKVLRGPLAPLIGGACGILPQCGFGVVAADLYSRKSIRLGTMITVFIATSDEAIPILLSAPTADSVTKLCVLLAFKFAAALIAGYALNLILRKRELTEFDESVVLKGCHRHELGEHTHEAHEHSHGHGDAHKHHDNREHDGHEHDDQNAREHDCVAHAHEHSDHVTDSQSEQGVHSDCHSERSRGISDDAAHSKDSHEKKHFDFKCFVLHPLLHTLTVSAYILAVNVAFAIILHFVGEARLSDFLMSAKFYQPMLAGLVGLIPNCASSVILAQLFANGSITLGAAFAGLSVNAGLGLAVLIKKNRPVKNTFYIAAGLYAYSCAVGLLLSFIPM